MNEKETHGLRDLLYIWYSKYLDFQNPNIQRYLQHKLGLVKITKTITFENRFMHIRMLFSNLHGDLVIDWNASNSSIGYID